MPRSVAGAPGGPRASRAAGRPRRAASERCAPASPPVPRSRLTASGGAAGPPRFLPPPPHRTVGPRRRGAPGSGSSGQVPPSVGPHCSRPELRPPRAAPSPAACAGLTAPDRVSGTQRLNSRGASDVNRTLR
ncbi:proline-rich protein HaeIII subfamily 1-like isoform X2 [Passer domesticus]|uniref:proline-rich protein HaeIII subfamily 1-like isoform X2 n=1 Tax=Passer domesticus TaxID=48849 RepID=UPI0030FEC1EE